MILILKSSLSKLRLHSNLELWKFNESDKKHTKK